MLLLTKCSELERALKSSDKDNSGYLKMEQIQLICNLISLPISDQLIEASMEK